MPNITTVVYLNDGDDHFSGFNRYAPPNCAKPPGSTSKSSSRAYPARDPGALEIVFEQLNIPSPHHSWAIAYRRAGQRSLSVGDVVVIGETAWACASSGWDLLTADQLHAALYH